MSATVGFTGLQSKDLRMIFFSSWEEFRKSHPLFHEDKKLLGVPYQIAPGSLVVPKSVVPLLRKKGLKFDVIKPIVEDELTPEQDVAVASNKAILIQRGGAIFFMRRVSRKFYNEWMLS